MTSADESKGSMIGVEDLKKKKAKKLLRSKSWVWKLMILTEQYPVGTETSVWLRSGWLRKNK